jgi:hypothetical protein
MSERFFYLCLVAATVVLPLLPACALYRALSNSAIRRRRIKFAAATYAILLAALITVFSVGGKRDDALFRSDAPPILLAHQTAPLDPPLRGTQ